VTEIAAKHPNIKTTSEFVTSIKTYGNSINRNKDKRLLNKEEYIRPKNCIQGRLFRKGRKGKL